MSFEFTADEIFALAEQIEINGEQFYRASAEKITDSEAIQLLLKLADMEVEHLKTYQAMRAELTGADQRTITFDPNSEAGLYLAALAKAKVFFEKGIEPSDLEGIFKAALTAEKDSIAFYLGMEDLISSISGREKIEAIIREEMRHIRLLGERLAALKT